jgi:hypothetical protein
LKKGRFFFTSCSQTICGEEMKSLIHLLGAISISTATIAAPAIVKTENCFKPVEQEQILRSSEFSWGVELEEIKTKYDEVYEKGLRLNQRAYLVGDQVVLPISLIGGGKGEIKLTERFLESVQGHIEEGLKRKYVDAIIFPDMGHSHLFVDQKFYNQVVREIPIKQNDKRYELMLNHPETRFLYHTAEQMKAKDENGKLLEDRHIQWRFYTRNLVGHNKAQGKIELLHNEGHSHNTARDYDEGFRYWGAGFNISATKNGCFAFVDKGVTKYFDLSLKDLEP